MNPLTLCIWAYLFCVGGGRNAWCCFCWRVATAFGGIVIVSIIPSVGGGNVRWGNGCGIRCYIVVLYLKQNRMEEKRDKKREREKKTCKM